MGLAVDDKGGGSVMSMSLSRQLWPNTNGLLDSIHMLGT
jgi:hypothetical protein